MKTWQDIDNLLSGLQKSSGSGLEPFALEAKDIVSDELIIDMIYSRLKEQIDKEQGRKLNIIVYPEIHHRSQPDKDGLYRKDAFFRLGVV